MKRLLLILALGLACRQSGPKELTGATTPKAAVDQYMLAIRAQDLQAISTIWGNSKGPARDQYPRPEIEKRSLLMVCYFNHDSYRITADHEASSKKHLIPVEIKKGGLTRTAEFTVERSRSNRWYASVDDVTSVKDFCKPPKPTG